jgi:hypothetical protein
MDDVLLALGNNDPKTTLDIAEKIFAKYGLILNRDKCKFTSRESSESINFFNLPLQPPQIQ